MANFAVTPTDTTFSVQVGENTLAAANSATAAAASAVEAEAAATTNAQQIGLSQLSIVDMAAGSINTGNTASYGFPDLSRPFARRIKRVKTTRNGTITLQTSVAGAGANQATKLIDPVSVTVVADTWVELPEPIEVPADAVVWARSPSGGAGLKYVSGTIPNGGVVWAALDTAIGTDTGYTISTVNGTQIEFEFEGEVGAGSADGALALQTVGQSGQIGFTSPVVNTGSVAPATFAVILPASDQWTHVTGVEVGQSAAGVGTLSIVTMTGTTLTTIHSQVSVTVPAGVNIIPVTADIPAGAQVVWQSAARFQSNGGGAGSLYINKALAPGDVALSNPHRLEFRVFVASGLTGRVGVLERQGAAPPEPSRMNDPWISARGYRTILEQSATALQGERAIAAGLNYRGSNPGAHIAFRTNSRWLDVQAIFNRVAVRDDNAIDDFAEVTVDGVTAATWTGSATAQRPRRVKQRVTLGASQAWRTVRVICPYGDGMVIEGLEVEAGADYEAATAAPAKIYVGVGDSITHGYNSTKPSAGWLWKLGEAKTARVLNMGIGGQIANAAHAADAAAAIAADGANATLIWMIGVNDCLQQRAVATYKAALADGITQMRSAAPSAPIVMLAPFWCPNAEALTIPLDSYRTAMQEAVSETAAGNVTFVNGKSAFTNDSTDIADGVHPGDTKNAAAATWLAGQIS